MKTGERVVYRGAVHEVVDADVRFGEPWLCVCAIQNGERSAARRWMPAKHVRRQLDTATRERAGMSEEEVRGIIIEAPETKTLYKFYVQIAGVEHRIDSGWFASDQEAEAYVKQAHSRAYARGVEMRAFDRDATEQGRRG